MYVCMCVCVCVCVCAWGWFKNSLIGFNLGLVNESRQTLATDHGLLCVHTCVRGFLNACNVNLKILCICWELERINHSPQSNLLVLLLRYTLQTLLDLPWTRACVCTFVVLLNACNVKLRFQIYGADCMLGAGENKSCMITNTPHSIEGSRHVVYIFQHF